MRAMTRVCTALAVCCLCTFGRLAPGFTQVAASPEEAGPLIQTDVAPFQSGLDRVAEEYLVKPAASGHVFGSFGRETFLFWLGQGTECVKQKTCVYVLFRNAQDNFPFVAFCDPGRFATAHVYSANGNPLSIFEFVCGQNTKFQLRLSRDSVRIESYVTLDDQPATNKKD
jgi:hypothetical protein